MKVYHISTEKKPTITLIPRIPNNWMTQNGFEDKTTPRACVVSNTQGALMAMSMNLKDKNLHIYSIDIDDNKIYKPTIKEVPDSRLTGELWIKEKITLKYEKSILVGEAKDKDYTYKFGNNEASLYKWNYKKANHSMYYFEKIARSYDAVRKKQYRQILKRMYGGNDEMVKAIKKSKDAGVYHGTRKENMGNILQDGFDSNKNVRGVYGKGTYFGDKKTALNYAGNDGDSFKERGEQLLRLRKPSELKGSKVTYGNQSNYKKIGDDKVKDVLVSKDSHLRKSRGDVSEVADRYTKLVSKKIKNKDDAAKHIVGKLNKSNIKPGDDALSSIKNSISRVEDGKSGRNKDISNMIKRRSEDRMDNNVKNIKKTNPKAFNRLQAYGKDVSSTHKKVMNDGDISAMGGMGNYMLSNKNINSKLITKA